ncbi:hypothetical protein LTR28_013115, partial [Elasticomyces elasticus]
PTNKRLAPPHPHPAESPAKKKQSKWSAGEDAAIVELRGNGMKWEDISRRLPGRSAISCRLRFQNYLERRSEWDEERKNKLARLYERFKKDMWEKISKEMALPWRAAEAMHWQIGEAEMAQRANVPVFHLVAGQLAPTSTTTTTTTAAPNNTAEHNESSISPTSATSLHAPPNAFAHTHSHGLPRTTAHATVQARNRRSSDAEEEEGSIATSTATSTAAAAADNRCRADSARSMASGALPSVAEMVRASVVGVGAGSPAKTRVRARER